MLNNKLIPALLIAVVMVAGAFAFAPIDQASTVHTTISDDLDALADVLCDIIDGEDYDPVAQVCIDGV